MNKTIEYILNLTADMTGVRSLPDTLTRPCDAVTLGIGGRYQTQPHTCGAVAGLMVLHYFKPRISAEAFYRRVSADVENGTGTTKLVRVLRSYGLRVQVRRDMTFADIAAAIDLCRPVLVTVKTRDPAVEHWVVCYGYGRKPNRIYLAGTGLPLVSRKLYPWQEFRRYHWAYVGEGLVCGRRKPARKGLRK